MSKYSHRCHTFVVWVGIFPSYIPCYIKNHEKQVHNYIIRINRFLYYKKRLCVIGIQYLNDAILKNSHDIPIRRLFDFPEIYLPNPKLNIKVTWSIEGKNQGEVIFMHLSIYKLIIREIYILSLF
jgi:hypothetical protein